MATAHHLETEEIVQVAVAIAVLVNGEPLSANADIAGAVSAVNELLKRSSCAPEKPAAASRDERRTRMAAWNNRVSERVQ